MPARFSVFIPVYNDARWLAGAIDSVLAQTHTDWELVIGDNASERDLQSIVAGYSDERIRYHRWDTHVDFVDNHNRTLGLCRYEWLNLLSADDRLHPDCLAKMAARLDELAGQGTTPAMIATACRPVDEEGRPATYEFSRSWRIKQLPDGLYDGRAWLHHIAAPGQVPWNIGSLAVRRDVVDVMGGFYRVEIGLSVDIDMALRVAAYGPVAYIDEPLLDYTVRAGGMNREVARKDRARARMTTHGRCSAPDSRSMRRGAKFGRRAPLRQTDDRPVLHRPGLPAPLPARRRGAPRGDRQRRPSVPPRPDVVLATAARPSGACRGDRSEVADRRDEGSLPGATLVVLGRLVRGDRRRSRHRRRRSRGLRHRLQGAHPRRVADAPPAAGPELHPPRRGVQPGP